MSSKDDKDADVKVPIVDPSEKADEKEEAGDEPTEKSPLKPEPTSVGSNGTPADVQKSIEKLDKEADEEDVEDGLAFLLSQPKPRFIIVTGLVIAFAVIAIIATVIAVSAGGDDVWHGDRTPRMLRLIPAPNGPGNLLRFRAGHDGSGTWPELTNQISDLYRAYAVESNLGKKNFTTCETRPPPNNELTCFFSSEAVKLLCNDKDNYGYPDARPCVLLQINHRQLFNWTPEVYSNDDLNRTEGLPDQLRKSYRATGPYVECKANTIVDEENAGNIAVAPSNELPLSFFPYNGHPDYMAPFLAVQFNKPTPNIIVGITCRLWAKNIGPRTEFDPATNMTRTVWPTRSLPDAEIPFNILVE